MAYGGRPSAIVACIHNKAITDSRLHAVTSEAARRGHRPVPPPGELNQRRSSDWFCFILRKKWRHPQYRKYITYRSCQRSNEPQPRLTRAENYVKFGHLDIQVDRRTYICKSRYTDTPVAILHTVLVKTSVIFGRLLRSPVWKRTRPSPTAPGQRRRHGFQGGGTISWVGQAKTFLTPTFCWPEGI